MSPFDSLLEFNPLRFRSKMSLEKRAKLHLCDFFAFGVGKFYRMKKSYPHISVFMTFNVELNKNSMKVNKKLTLFLYLFYIKFYNPG